MYKNKIRDITRSILPSRARKGARDDKAQANRANRHAVKRALHSYNKHWDEDDGESKLVGRIAQSDAIRARNIRMVVSERRNADKLNHFIRWCKARTNDIPESDPRARYDHVSSLMGGPADLIREHALGHFISPYQFNLADRERWRAYLATPYPCDIPRIVVERALREAFEICHKQLHKAIKGDSSSSPTYRRCRDHEPCTTYCEIRRKKYSYARLYWRGRSHRRESFNKPLEGEYKEGTLSERWVIDIETQHDDSLCPNRILLQHPDDIEDLVDHICHRSGYTYYRYSDALGKRVIKFLIAKGFLEDPGIEW